MAKYAHMAGPRFRGRPAGPGADTRVRSA